MQRVLPALLFLAISAIHAGPEIARLEGSWKLSKIDKSTNARPELDDERWQNVDFPTNLSRLDSKVFWIRRKVQLSRDDLQKSPALVIGAIYDKDETYFNGELIGSKKSGYGHPRIYVIPMDIIQEGENTLAIRLEGQFTDQIGITSGPLELQYIEDAEWNFLSKDIKDLIFAALFFISGAFFIILYRRMRQFKEYFWYGIFAICFALQQFLRNEIRMDVADLFFAFKLAEQLSYVAMPTAFFYFFFRIFKLQIEGYFRYYPWINALAAAGILLSFSPIIWNYIISFWFFVNIPVFAYYLYVTYQRAVQKKEKTAIILGVGILFMITNVLYYHATQHGWIQGTASLSAGGLVFNLFVSVALIHRLIKLQQNVRSRQDQLNTVNELRDRIFSYLHAIVRKPADKISDLFYEIRSGSDNGHISELKYEIDNLQANLDDILELSRLEVIVQPEYTEQVNFNDFITAVIPQNIITCHIKVNPEIVLSTSLELVNSIVIRLIDFPGFRRFRHIDLIITSDLKNNVHFRFLMFHPEFRHTRRLYELLTSENPDQSSMWIKWAIIRQIVKILAGELKIHIINRKFLRIDIKLPAFSTSDSQRKLGEIRIQTEGESPPELSLASVTAEPVAPKLKASMSLSELGLYIRSRLKRKT